MPACRCCCNRRWNYPRRRKRKKEYLETLESKSKTLNDENAQLQVGKRWQRRAGGLCAAARVVRARVCDSVLRLVFI